MRIRRSRDAHADAGERSTRAVGRRDRIRAADSPDQPIERQLQTRLTDRIGRLRFSGGQRLAVQLRQPRGILRRIADRVQRQKRFLRRAVTVEIGHYGNACQFERADSPLLRLCQRRDSPRMLLFPYARLSNRTEPGIHLVNARPQRFRQRLEPVRRAARHPSRGESRQRADRPAGQRPSVAIEKPAATVVERKRIRMLEISLLGKTRDRVLALSAPSQLHPCQSRFHSAEDGGKRDHRFK